MPSWQQFWPGRRVLIEGSQQRRATKGGPDRCAGHSILDPVVTQRVLALGVQAQVRESGC